MAGGVKFVMDVMLTVAVKRHLLKITNYWKSVIKEVEELFFQVHEERRRVPTDVTKRKL